MARVVPNHRARLAVGLREFDNPHALVSVTTRIRSEPRRSREPGPRQSRPNEAPIHRVVRASYPIGTDASFTLMLDRPDQRRNLGRDEVNILLVSNPEMRYR